MSTQQRVVVVGAGISGLACAQALREAGIGVGVVDRGRRPGGRMASRTLWGRAVDLGASYLTVSEADFGAVVDDWCARGLARPWTDTFAVLGDGDPRESSGPVRYGAAGGLRSLVLDLAEGLEITTGEVTELPVAEAVVLAMPDPQARRVLGEGHPLAASLRREFEPVLAVAAAWSERGWELDGAFVNDHEVLAWVADDGSRRGDGAPVLVAHTTPSYAARHLEEPQAAGPEVVAAVRGLLDLGEPDAVHVHRWSFARPVGDRPAPYLLEAVDAGLLGVCGDGWGPSPKVETAWRSGHALGLAVADRLS